VVIEYELRLKLKPHCRMVEGVVVVGQRWQASCLGVVWLWFLAEIKKVRTDPSWGYRTLYPSHVARFIMQR